MKKGSIDLPTQQWNSMGEAIYLMGRQKTPSKTQSFFAPIDVAAAALAHRGEHYGQEMIAIPHVLKLYQQRFLKKDPINNPDQFQCIQASLVSDGLLAINYEDGKSFLEFVLDAYEAYVTAEYRKNLAITSPRANIKYKTRQQFHAALKQVFSYCHHYVSYHPFGCKNRVEAFERCKQFYHDNWSTFLTDYAHLDMPKDKFSAFKRFLLHKGTETWYDLKLWDAKITYVTDSRGDMGGFLLNDEVHVLYLIQGYLVSRNLEEFLPEAEGEDASSDYLSSIQEWLRHPDTEKTDVERFGWLKQVELSESFYNSELVPLHDKLMAEHAKVMEEKAKKAKEVKKHNEYCQRVLDFTPKWTTYNSLIEQKKRALDEANFQEGWGEAWKPLTTYIKAGELKWESAVEAQFPQQKKARWTEDQVPRTKEEGYATNQQAMMEKHLRPQYEFKLASADPDHEFQSRTQYWEKWWADFNAYENTRHLNRTHNWKGEWRLDGKKDRKGDSDSQIRQSLWDALQVEVPLSLRDTMIVPGVAGDDFAQTNHPVLFKLRGVVEMLYHSQTYLAPSYNDPALLEASSGLSDVAIYVAIKLGFIRRDWGREHRGSFGNYNEAIMESLSEWVQTYILRGLNMLLKAFYECCMQHCPTVKRAIYDYLGQSYNHPCRHPKWEHRIIHKVAREIYSERGEINIPNYGRAPYKRAEVPVSASYEAASPIIKKNPNKQEKAWLANALKEGALNDYGYWDPTGAKGLNPKEAARSALLWRRCRTKIGLNDESDSDYSADLESESEDERKDEDLIDGKWTDDEVFDCVPKISGKDKNGRDKWVGVVEKEM